jgi:ceramide glucosyltransferase
MLMPVQALAATGGFAAVRNLLGEDQAIGLRMRRAGYSIRLSHHVIGNISRGRNLKAFLARQSRWNKVRRGMAPVLFLAEPVTNLATVGLVWAFSGESGIAWGGFLLLVGLGLIRDALQTRRLRGSFPRLRHLLLSPAKDILLLPIWFDAVFNRRVIWRGHRFLVGRMTRLRLARVPRQVRRRVRRVRQIRLQQAKKPNSSTP